MTGHLLAALRRQKGLSQEALAAISGLSRACISLIERDEVSPTVATLMALAEALGIEAGALLSPHLMRPRPDGLALFYLDRLVDDSGISGTGRVAEGVRFSDGTCCLRWMTAHRSAAFYANLADLEAIHGHGGNTRIVWEGLEP